MAFLSGSVFSENNNDTDGDSVKRYNLRGVFAPLHEPGNVVHLGLQYAYRDLEDSAVDTGSVRAWACAASPPMAVTMPAAMATVACSAAVRQSRAVEG